jgi:flagellar motor switch protein FliM
MKPERAFIAERAIAQHDPALLRPGPASTELIPALGRLSERMAKAIRDALVPLLGGAEPQINPMKPMRTDYADFCSEIPRLAANSLMHAGDVPFVMTIEGETVLRLVDRAFGGPGDTPSSLPREFPLSAELMIARVEQLVGTCLASALGAPQGLVRFVRRDAAHALLMAMPEDTDVAALTFNVVEQGRMPWSIGFAFPLDTLGQLLAHAEPKRPASAPRGPASPHNAPFAELPIELSAVLVDMRLPLATVSALSVGQVLPVSIPRSVPLRIADRTCATGTIGALEDRVAIQISQLS